MRDFGRVGARAGGGMVRVLSRAGVTHLTNNIMAHTSPTPDSRSTQQRGQETTFRNTTARAEAGKQPGDRDAGTPEDAVESDVQVPRNEREDSTVRPTPSRKPNEDLHEEDAANSTRHPASDELDGGTDIDADTGGDLDEADRDNGRA